MFIFPAIDLIEGCAVRLVRGDYAQKTVYSDNPAAVAQSFAKAGAQFLHLVDLDGALAGRSVIWKAQKMAPRPIWKPFGILWQKAA